MAPDDTFSVRDEQNRSVLRPSTVRELNLATIVKALRNLGPQPRSQLSASTGLSAAAVTKLTAVLLQADVLIEAPKTTDQPRGTGRPRVPLDLTPDRRVVLAVHLGPERVQLAATDLRGAVIRRTELALGSHPPEQILREAAARLPELYADAPAGARAVGIGVTSDGEIDQAAGVLRRHPVLGWLNVPVVEIIAEATSLPTQYAEVVPSITLQQRQALRLADDLLHLHIDGLARCVLMTSGRLHLGANDQAGQLHHWSVPDAGEGPLCLCGRRDCFSQLATGAALVTRARHQGVLSPAGTYADLVRIAEADDRAAVRMLDQRVDWISQLLSTAADLVDPAEILVSGSVLDWAPFTDRLEAALDRLGPDRRYLIKCPDGPLDLAAAAAFPLLEAYFTDLVRFEPTLRGVDSGGDEGV